MTACAAACDHDCGACDERADMHCCTVDTDRCHHHHLGEACDLILGFVGDVADTATDYERPWQTWWRVLTHIARHR